MDKKNQCKKPGFAGIIPAEFYSSVLPLSVGNFSFICRVPCTGAPQLERTSSTGLARDDAAAQGIPSKPQGYLKHVGVRKLKKYTFCNTLGKFCLIPEPGEPGKFHPCPRQTQVLAW